MYSHTDKMSRTIRGDKKIRSDDIHMQRTNATPVIPYPMYPNMISCFMYQPHVSPIMSAPFGYPPLQLFMSVNGLLQPVTMQRQPQMVMCPVMMPVHQKVMMQNTVELKKEE